MIPLSRRLQLPPQEQISGHSQHHKDDYQRHNVQGEVGVQHVEFLQSGLWRLEVTIGLVTLQLFPAKRVRGQCGAFEAVADVRQIGNPAKVYRNGVEGDKEAGEEQERYRHDGRQKDTVLNVHSGTNDKANGLCDKGDHQTRGQEHGEAEHFHGLRCEIVDDRHINHAEDSLKVKNKGY